MNAGWGATTIRTLLFSVGVACLTLLGGCGKGIGELSGRVTFKDRPLRMGTVLVSAENGVRSATIQDDGSYSVLGIASGPVKLAVTCPDPRGVVVAKRKMGPPVADAPKLGDTKKWFPIPDKYGDFEQSELTFTVRSGTNTFNIELK